MKARIAIMLLFLIGIGIVSSFAWAIRDLVWYGLCCDGTHVVRFILASIGMAGYIPLVLTFAFNR